MPFAVVDTETSGLLDFKAPADAAHQPRLASIAIIRVDDALQIEGEPFTMLVKPDGWMMTPGAIEVNGLTDDILHGEGRPVGVALDEYAQVVDSGRTIVAHSTGHDLKIMRGEFRRAGRPDRFGDTGGLCTMRTLHGIVRNSSGRGWPKLADCLAHYGLTVDGVPHMALRDAMGCLALLRHMRGINLLMPDGSVNYGRRTNLMKAAKEARAGAV